MVIPEYDESYRPTLQQKREELVRWALVGDPLSPIPSTLNELANRTCQAMILYHRFNEEVGQEEKPKPVVQSGGISARLRYIVAHRNTGAHTWNISQQGPIVAKNMYLDVLLSFIDSQGYRLVALESDTAVFEVRET
jgi:hypothetical protein